jgi:hypothetical protein
VRRDNCHVGFLGGYKDGNSGHPYHRAPCRRGHSTRPLHTSALTPMHHCFGIPGRSLASVATVHLIAVATSTYVAAIDVESIVVSGLVCSATGGWLGYRAARAGHQMLAVVGWGTPAMAALLFVLEAFVLQLGPAGAAFPFCVVFIVHQVLATLVILVQLHLMLTVGDQRPTQVALKTLLVAMTGFALFSTMAHYLLMHEHSTLMLIALGLLGVTSVGLLSVWIGAFLERRRPRDTEDSPPQTTATATTAFAEGPAEP